VSRLAWLGMFLMFSHALVGQQGQGHGGPPRPSTDTSIQDFKRAMAVQAAPDQISDYQTLAKNTEDAKQAAHALQAKAGAASDGTGFYQPASALKDSVDQIMNSERVFVKGFTKAQTVLLKDHTKKLSKAETEVTKEGKNLDEAMKRSAIDPKELAGVAGRVEKVLTDLQSQQQVLADEMGVPKG